jgi:hypothetical protein
LIDSNGGTDTATVTIDVVEAFSEPQVNFIFSVGRTLLDDNTGLPVIDPVTGRPVFEEISQVQIGDSFEVQVLVQDITPGALGVFSAYLDMIYNSDLVQVDGGFNDFVFSDVYINSNSGDPSSPGLIDELGGLDGISVLDGTPTPLVNIPFIATAAGSANFTGNPADILPNHETTLFGQNLAIPSGAQVFLDDTVDIVSSTGNSSNEFVNFENPLDVNADGNVSPIDALLVINDINLNGSRNLTTTTALPLPGIMVDVNSDQNVSPIDVILVVNRLNEDGTVGVSGIIADNSQLNGSSESHLEDDSDENSADSGFVPNGNSNASVDSSFSRNTIDAVLSHVDDADEEDEDEWLTNLVQGIV